MLAFLFCVNLLNYIDRQIVFAVFPLIQEEFRLSDAGLGVLASMFMWVYLVSALPLGYWGDRVRRFPLMAGVIGLWSLATVASGLARSYAQLLWARAVVGIGEAGYGAIGPGVISDLYSPASRGRALSFFFIAIPVGSALGYLLGGGIGERFGWRAAFWIVGLPGLAASLTILSLREPDRGESDVQAAIGRRATVTDLLRNPTYLWNTLAMTALTFVIGGLAAWMPTFLVRVKGLSVAEAALQFGSITAITGISGTLLGGWLGDHWFKRSIRAYSLLSAAGMAVAVPFVFLALDADAPAAYLSGIFLAELMIFLNTAPLNAVIVHSTTPDIRALAFGVNMVVIHALGDAFSPVLIGSLSDHWGMTAAIAVTAPAGLVLAALLCLKTAGTMKRGDDPHPAIE